MAGLALPLHPGELIPFPWEQLNVGLWIYYFYSLSLPSLSQKRTGTERVPSGPEKPGRLLFFEAPRI